MSDNFPWIISVDDHVLEPPHVWQERLPAKYRDAGPKLVTDDKGEAWVYEHKRMATSGLSAAAGRKKQQFSPLPLTYAEMRAGCYDSRERLADMDLDHVLASLCFPSFPRFCGQTFAESSDLDLGLACVEAYNDWMIDEWCGAAPGRFIPLIIIPLWDSKLGAAEIERCAAKGAKAIAFSENPSALGLPSIHDANGFWDPVLTAANDTGLVICQHIGSSSSIPQTSPDAPLIVQLSWGPAVNCSGALTDWLFSGHLLKQKDLKICLSEGGIGWLPYFLERAQYTWDRQRYWATQGDFGDFLLNPTSAEESGPSDVSIDRTVDLGDHSVMDLFRDHIYGCFIEDYNGIAALDYLGVDNVLAETDYPHTDSSWPESKQGLQKQLAGLSEGDVYKILQGNARRVFNFTPADVPVTAS